MKIALSIAGSDPTGGAGIQLDVQVFRCLGVHGAAVITALTVQDTRGVRQVLPVFPGVVRDQLRTLLDDVSPHAIKLGQLATDDVLRAVDLGLDALPAGAGPPIVLDPVLLASDGTALLERRAWPGLRSLAGRATLVTPNLPEAEALSGRDVSSRAGVEAAGRELLALGARAVLVKGGHAEGPPADCLLEAAPPADAVCWLEGERIPGPPVHGTGCALSSAIAAGLALGAPLRDAVQNARAFVVEAIRGAQRLGEGARILGLP